LSSSVVTIQGDTWDIVAKRVWGNEKLMDTLIEANPSQRHRMVFPAGCVLTVPDVSVGSSVDVPPWRR